ncbi:CgeB family protein [Oharaeibacter diazotrophicus]|uniref:Uncharacterized protein DUF3880 n=1 Tax=Oharaeibacter diazotrophicus TaxID=1920512 RepID=A0A4R6R917_9HYPH|nr:glycosyltransferase [Oharaeibacter diazotrophicus]TDP82315.1 uncharacterized protein DUF3880 [Oharaeibacter diazotrophicus]BBE72922.1 hypothetical protein OHA_1_02521 [Pleomorphomonas sp. SM30]GLS76960.1 hypothetical protein GCM10007904_22970 [Oharaeibacter diazotrophicus]
MVAPEARPDRSGTVGGTLRILMVAELWHGSDSLALARALIRLGHSVAVVSDEMFQAPGLRSRVLRAARRLAMPLIKRDFNAELLAGADQFEPHLLLVCKGVLVRAETIRAIKARGARAFLWWPDISMIGHGPEVPRAVPHYDWVFTTKSFGVDDLRARLGVDAVTFMPPGFDPETHEPIVPSAADLERYRADLAFVGTWSPKKQAILEAILAARPTLDLAIWGDQWEKAAGGPLARHCRLRPVYGREYSKAITVPRIALGLLSEIRAGASDGDRITARTFQIPAAGGFMLHERNPEVARYFTDGVDCAMFADVDEAVALVDRYLADPAARDAVAAAGRARCVAAGYSVDDRARTIVAQWSATTARGGRPGEPALPPCTGKSASSLQADAHP